jgi:dolichol-phosphate mannosyltransferase
VQLTVVLPTYNELENLRALVPILLGLPLDLSLLIVDDDSPDGTGALADELARQSPGRVRAIHRRGQRGLGGAYRLGFHEVLKTGSEAICQMDTDFSHPAERLPEMAACLSEADIVIGSRYVPGGSVDANWPLWRKGLSRWGNFYGRAILSMPMRDVTGGYRLWRREVIAAMPWERILSNGYVFQIETIHVAHRLGFRVAELPIYFADRTWGQSKMNWRIQFEAAWRVWWVRARYRDLRPGPRSSTG